MESTSKLSRQEIRGEIVSQGRTQRDVAEAIGVSEQTVSDTLAGRSAGASTRYAIARELGLDPESIDWTLPGRVA